MSSGTPYIGTKISLVSKSEIRYEGILYSIDTKDAVVTLANVRSFGTEDRDAPKKVPPREEVYEYIVFRGQDIKDLHVCEVPATKAAASQLPQDPAIVQSGSSRHPGSYSHFHTPVTYPLQPMNYGPFGGPYGGYPPGGQHAHMPGPMQPHPGMMGSMMPPRIPTPPPVQPIPVARSHTPSPETVLPTAPSSNNEQVKVNETQDKSTTQQGTQTVHTKKRPSSRPSSRRNSEDKTEAAQEKKKQEAKDKENINKESGGTNQSALPQRQRQGGNRRTQGRRGGSSTRGSKPRTGGDPVKFEGEFDFESSNAKFNKEEIEEELQQKLHENLRITDEVENTAENEVIHDQPQSPVSFYDSSKSFFDSISCEANDRDKNRRAHPSWQQERKVNMETFGVTGGMRRGGRGRGRGRGGYRGGRGGSRYQGREDSGRGGRGGWRGGRGGSRGGRSKAWVDYPINDGDKLPKNLANGPSVTGDGQPTAKA
ncbi:hypothetical protein ACROYT_G011430 [Oculina patagonica]